MEVSIGANCYNGMRRKSLSDSLTEDVPQLIEQVKKASSSDHQLRSIVTYMVPGMLLAGALKPLGVFAEEPVAVTVMGDGVKANILHAFDPLIDLIQALAYPIAGVMIAGGCLFIMCGQRDKGMSMLQNAAMGYILVQLSPMMLKLLVGIGGSI